MGIPSGLIAGRPDAPLRAAPAVSPLSHLSLTPPEAPLEMPRQTLGGRRRCVPLSARAIGHDLRRTTLILATFLAAAFSFWGVSDVLAHEGLRAVEVATAVLSAALTAWVAFSFASAMAGFCLAWRGPPERTSARLPSVSSRTAILMPVYNEDPGRVFAALQAMGEDLRARGVAHLYDIFVLSDTRDAGVARAEAAGVLRLRVRLEDGVGVYYRRRQENTEKKAGNIADWVRRWGDAYESMLVLDADSIMSGEAIVRLTAAMERDPELGLLQSVPTLVNAETPFARLQQFAAWLYGPIFAMGQHWWSGAEGNYWGHNAIIRVRAFAASAGLPKLKGRAPWGGHIQSHDFVEAALLRRDGWAVRMWPDLPGSYEETPPTLIDTAIRDRRWCQGNLQHARLLGASGLHWVGRLHLFRGVMSYLTAPLWLALLICGAFVWPGLETTTEGQARLTALFSLTIAMLLVPKALGLLVALRDPALRKRFGGARRLVAGAALETTLSMLLAPVQLMMQAGSVIDVLLGRDSGWAAQSRDEGDTCPHQAWRAHRMHVGIGVLGTACASMVDRHLFLWSSPVLVGLALSWLLSMYTARADLGQALRRRGLLLTPAETAPQAVLARTLALRDSLIAETGRRWAVDRLFRASVPFYRLAPALVRWAEPERAVPEAA
jgi:membrane glycosyltransferase